MLNIDCSTIDACNLFYAPKGIKCAIKSIALNSVDWFKLCAINELGEDFALFNFFFSLVYFGFKQYANKKKISEKWENCALRQVFFFLSRCQQTLIWFALLGSETENVFPFEKKKTANEHKFVACIIEFYKINMEKFIERQVIGLSRVIKFVKSN